MVRPPKLPEAKRKLTPEEERLLKLAGVPKDNMRVWRTRGAPLPWVYAAELLQRMCSRDAKADPR